MMVILGCTDEYVKYAVVSVENKMPRSFSLDAFNVICQIAPTHLVSFQSEEKFPRYFHANAKLRLTSVNFPRKVSGSARNPTENLHVLFQQTSFGQMESTSHLRDITHQIHRHHAQDSQTSCTRFTDITHQTHGHNIVSEEFRTPEQ